MSGGCMAPAAGPRSRSPRSRGPCWRDWPAGTGTSATAARALATSAGATTRREGGCRRTCWPPRPPARRRRLHLRSGRVHGRDVRRTGRPGHRWRPRAHRDLRRRAFADAGHRARRRPAAAPASGRSQATGPPVAFARSGLTVPWDQGYASLLELAEACDVPVRWSCRTGVCHTCETALLSGTVSYAPDPVDDPADGSALICCSQPRGDLVLDL